MQVAAGLAALAALGAPKGRSGMGGRFAAATAAGVCAGAYIALEFFPGQPPLQVRHLVPCSTDANFRLRESYTTLHMTNLDRATNTMLITTCSRLLPRHLPWHTFGGVQSLTLWCCCAMQAVILVGMSAQGLLLTLLHSFINAFTKTTDHISCSRVFISSFMASM